MAFGGSRYQAYQKKKEGTELSKVSGINKETNKGGLLGGIGYVAGNVLGGVASVGEGIVDLFSAGGSLLAGDVDYAKYVFKDNVVGEWQKDLREDYNPGTVMSFLGDVGTGIGQSSVFLLNAIPGLGQLGTAAFFAGVSSQGISGAAEKTGDVGLKEVTYGVLSGAAEAGLEYALGGMGKLAKNIGSPLAKNVGRTAVRRGLFGQILSDASQEFLEEFASEYIDTFLQRTTGVDKNATTSLKDAIYAGAVGFVSGGVSAGSGSVVKATMNESNGKKIAQRGNAQTLINTATAVADKLAGAGTDFKKAPEWVRALRGEVDAYNKLVEKGKQDSARGYTILGEMQASLSFAELQSVAFDVQESVQKASEGERAEIAEYINRTVDKKNRKKDYTAEDVAKNVDDIAWQWTIIRLASKGMNLEEAMYDKKQESGIEDIIAKEQAREASRAAARQAAEPGAGQTVDESFVKANERAQDNVAPTENVENVEATEEAKPKFDLASEEDRAASERERRTAALREFGMTNDFSMTGFVLENGAQLKLSPYGLKSVNHSLIEKVYDDATGSDAVNRFIQEGNVRIKASSPGIELSSVREMSQMQYNIVSRFLAKALREDGMVYIDFTDADGKDVGTLRYFSEEDSADSIIWDIKDYYRKGSLPRHAQYDLAEDVGGDTAAVSNSEKARQARRARTIEAASAAKVDVDAVRAQVKKATERLIYDGQIYSLTDEQYDDIASVASRLSAEGMSTGRAIAEAIDSVVKEVGVLDEGGKITKVFSKQKIGKVKGAMINGVRKLGLSNMEKTTAETETVEAVEGTEEAKKSEPEVKEAKESLTDKQRAERAKSRVDKWLEWEKESSPSAEELNRAREIVKGFDNLKNHRRLAIIRMMRSAEGVDANIVKGVANLLAVVPRGDVEIRFAKGVGNRGLATPLGKKTVIVLNSDANYNATVKGTVAHEIVHYLEDKEGYKALAEFARANATAEDIEKHRKRYVNGWAKIGYKYTEAELEQEITASLVGDALNNEQFMRRYAEKDSSILQKAYSWLKTVVSRLKNKGKDTEKVSKAAQKMMLMVDTIMKAPTVGERASGVKYATSNNAGYDYTKPFYQQVEDYKNGLFPKDDSLLLGETPEVFKSIGFNSLPMTINQRHIDYALNGTKNADHEIGELLLKYLPTALKKPVAIITSSTHKNTSVVAIVSITHNGNQINAAVYVDGTGTLNGIEIDSNAITSVYSRKNAITTLLKDAIDDELNGKIGVYYWDKKRAVALLSGKKVTMPNTLNTLSDGSIHSIRENASPVKPKFENVTESQQFKRWFGDWQNHPNTASKVVNSDGTPKILYHQTSEDFTVFDPRHKGAGTNDDETPFGIFMKPADNDIGLKGKKQMALYARIVKPLIVNDRADLVYRLKSLSPKYEELIKQRNALSAEYNTKLEEAAKAWGQYAKDYRANHPDATRSDIYNDPEFKKLYDAEDLLTEEWIEKADALSLQMKEEITKTLKDNNYDGVILKKDSGSGGRTVETYIALEPTQVKSATDNIGTFDKTNPDIRYDLADDGAEKQSSKLEEKAAEKERLDKLLKKKEQQLRKKIARENAEAARAERAKKYTKQEISGAVNAIEALTDVEILSLAKGYELKGMTKTKRDDLISKIYIALHEESAKGESGLGSIPVKGLATKIAWDTIVSAEIKGEDGNSYHFSDIYDEASIQQFAQELAEDIYYMFGNMGEHTDNSYFQAEIRAVKERFRQERFNDERITKFAREVSYQGMKLRDIAAHQKREGAAEGLEKITKKLAAIVDPKGNIRVGVIDQAMHEASVFLEGEAGKLESEINRKRLEKEEPSAVDIAETVMNEGMRYEIDEFIRLRKGHEKKPLTAEEMEVAGNILRRMKKIIEEYNKETIDGHLVDVDQAVTGQVEDLLKVITDENKKEYKTKIGEFFSKTIGKGANELYFYKILSPEGVLGALEYYRDGGLLQTMYHSIRVAQQKSAHMETQMLKPFQDYLDDKKNRWESNGKDGGRKGFKYSYRDKLTKKKIRIDGKDIFLGEAINLYMLTKREAAHAGLLESGYITYDKNGKQTTVKIADIVTTRSNIYNKLDKVDIEFLKMAEHFFNSTASDIKYKADIKIFGYSNNVGGYYVPMVRNRYARTKGVTDARFSIGETVSLYSPSFTKNLVANAQALEGENIMALIDKHARGLADYSEMYLPLKAFDRVYNRGVSSSEGGVTSIREVLNTKVWSGTETYLKQLFQDIQGQREQSDAVVDRLVGKLRSGWVISVLGANIKVVFTQSTSLGAATQVIEPKYLMPALSTIFKFKGESISALRERAYKYSDIIEARVFDKGAIKSQSNVEKVNELAKKTGFLIERMDEQVCLTIFHAAELKVQAVKGYAIGTEENAIEAAKICDETILKTQAMTAPSEKSALQRSTSEIAKTLSMFTSDTVKNLSHLWSNTMKYFAHRSRAAAGDAKYQAMLKEDAKEMRRSMRTLAITGLMMALITQLFKYIYAKEEEETEDKVKDLAIDVFSSTVNILPIVSDIFDKFVFNYDISLNVFDMANDIIESTGRMFKMTGDAMSGDYISTNEVIRNSIGFIKTVGAGFGIPLAPMERTVTGLVRRFTPSLIYGYDSMIYTPSYTADLKKAIEDGDEALSEHILSTLYKNEVAGVYTSEELEEVARLYAAGQTGVLPQKVGEEINGIKLNRTQRKRFDSIYSGASDEVNKLIRSSYYTGLTDEQRAKAIKNIYAMYYGRAANEIAGKEMTTAVAYSYLTDNYSALFAAQAFKSGLSEQIDANGDKVTVREQFVDYAANLGLSEVDALVVSYANGVKDKKTRAAFLEHLNSVTLDAEIKKQVAERLGFVMQDGTVTEAEE